MEKEVLFLRKTKLLIEFLSAAETKGPSAHIMADPCPVTWGGREKELPVESSKTHLFCSLLLTSPMT